MSLSYLSSNLKYLREQRGMTQRHVAEKLNMKSSAIVKIEGGHSGISVERLMMLADLFGVDEHKLLRIDLRHTSPKQERLLIAA